MRTNQAHPSNRLHLVLLFCALALCMAAAPLRAQERPPWWQGAWHYRTLLSPTAIGPEEFCVWLETGPRAKRDGSDIWIIGPKGRSLPSKILCSSPEGRHLLVFKAEKGEKGLYAAYYGNPEGGAPAPLQAPSGLFLRTFPLAPDAKMDSWADAQKALATAPAAYGAALWNQVFDSANPFSPDVNYVSIYDGRLDCPKDGSYQFATVSDDASFLLVDGALVAQWPGRGHDVNTGRHGQHGGKVDLKAGRHGFTYIGFSVKGPKRMLAAWMPPGEGRFSVIPASSFVGVGTAQEEICEEAEKPVTAGFRFLPLQYLELDERKMVAMQFTSLGSARVGQITKCSWNFGDGQSAVGDKPVHVYLESGNYTVTLTVAASAGGSDSFDLPVSVLPLWNDLEFTLAKQQKFAEWCRDAQPAALKTPHLLALRDLAKANEARRLLFDADVELDKRRSELSRDQVAALEQELADYYLDPLRQWQDAQRCLQVALSNSPAERQPDLRLRIADIYFYYANDPARARQGYEQLRRDLPESDKDRRRVALVRLGDLERLQKHPDEARRLYSQAEADPAFPLKEPRAVTDGRYRHEVEAYLGQGDGQSALTSLEQWLWALPTHRLDGETMLLRLKANMLTKNFDEVKKQADQYIACADDADFLPQANLYAGLACVQSKRPVEARAYLKVVGERWPESPAAAQARAALGQLK